MTDKLNRIQESFKAVYGPLSKAIGDCLLTLNQQDIDATAVISAIMSVAIDIAAKANKLAKGGGHAELVIDVNHLTRFVALNMASTLPVSDEIRKALDAVVLAGTDFKTPTAPGSSKLN